MEWGLEEEAGIAVAKEAEGVGEGEVIEGSPVAAGGGGNEEEER